MRVSPEKISEYLRFRFGGHTNKQASSLAGISSKTGTNYLKSIREEARRSGLLTVLKSYNLEIHDLFELGGEIKEKGLSVDDCQVGLNIATILAQLKINPKKIESFARDIFTEAERQRISSKEIAVTIAEFTKLRKESKLNFREASNKYRELYNEIIKLEEESLSLKNEIKSLRLQLNKELKEEKITKIHLRKFNNTRDTLKKNRCTS